MKTLHISAGGKNTRLKNFLDQEFKGIPKHILPLPQKKMTVIEAIVANAEIFFERIIIEANGNNILFISPLFHRILTIETKIDDICS